MEQQQLINKQQQQQQKNTGTTFGSLCICLFYLRLLRCAFYSWQWHWISAWCSSFRFMVTNHRQQQSTLTDSLGLLICGRSLLYFARIKLIDFSFKLFYSCKGESEGVFANFSKLEHSIIWNNLSREWPMTKSCILTIITNELLPVCKNSECVTSYQLTTDGDKRRNPTQPNPVQN